jgi:phage terminase large subunit-like protein
MFPIGKHDDTVDAMAYAWQMCGSKRGWGAV